MHRVADGGWPRLTDEPRKAYGQQQKTPLCFLSEEGTACQMRIQTDGRRERKARKKKKAENTKRIGFKKLGGGGRRQVLM